MNTPEKFQSPFVGKKRLDSGSIHSLMCALGKRNDEEWTMWDLKAVADVTLAFLSSRKLCISEPPRVGPDPNFGPVRDINTILADFVEQDHISPQVKRKAEQAVVTWIDNNPKKLAEAFDRYRKESSFDPWMNWHIAKEWEHHVNRLKSLIDPPFIEKVATILGWNKAEQRKFEGMAKDKELVKSWSKYRRLGDDYPPTELIDGFALSSLIRGRYYWLIARERPEPVILQAGRNHVVGSVEVSESKLLEQHKTEVYLAAMIVLTAMRDNETRNFDEQKAIQKWATNVRLVKERVYQIAPEHDHERALSRAFDLARVHGLQIPELGITEKHIVERWSKIIGVVIGYATQIVPFVGPLIHEGAKGFHAKVIDLAHDAVVKGPYKTKMTRLGQRFLSVSHSDLSDSANPMTH